MRSALCFATLLLAAAGALASATPSPDHPADGVYDVGSYLVRFRASDRWQVVVNAPREFINLRFVDGPVPERPERLAEFNIIRLRLPSEESNLGEEYLARKLVIDSGSFVRQLLQLNRRLPSAFRKPSVRTVVDRTVHCFATDDAFKRPNSLVVYVWFPPDFARSGSLFILTGKSEHFGRRAPIRDESLGALDELLAGLTAF